jgi:hypothetical protein
MNSVFSVILLIISAFCLTESIKNVKLKTTIDTGNSFIKDADFDISCEYELDGEKLKKLTITQGEPDQKKILVEQDGENGKFFCYLAVIIYSRPLTLSSSF